MADNRDRGSSDAFRRRQEARRRREPQTIDAKAQDVTTSPLSEPAEPGPQQSHPVSEDPPSAEAQTSPASDNPARTQRDAPLGAADEPILSPMPAPAEGADRAGADRLAETDADRAAAAAFPGVVADPARPAEPKDPILNPTVTAEPLPWLEGDRRANETVAAADESRPADPLASGDPVPMSDFVRTPTGESSEPAPAEDTDRVSEVAHPTQADVPAEHPGSIASEPLPMSEVVRSPNEVDPDLPRAPAHEPDVVAAPLSSSSEPGTSLGNDAPPDPALSRDRDERFSDAAPRSAPPAADRRTYAVPAGLAALALLILAGLAGIYYGLKLGNSDELAGKVDALTQRVATLEARPVPAAPSVDLGALDTRSAALGGEVASLKAALADLSAKLEQTTRAASENSGRIAALEQHATAAPPAQPPAAAAENASPPASSETSPSQSEPNSPPAVPAPATSPTIASPPAPTGSGEAGAAPVAAPPPPSAPAVTDIGETSAQLAALTGKVEDLAKRLAALPTEAPAPVDLAPLQGRISDLAARLEAQQAAVAALPKVDEARLDTRLTGLDQKADENGRRVTEVAQAMAAIPKLDLAPLQASIADVDARLKPVEAALAAPKSGDRVTEARAVGSTEESRAAPLAVVAGAIARALNEGRPFAPEVDALRGLGIEDAALGPLPVLAGPGAPTAETLRDRWADIQTKVLTAAGPKTGDSVLDRFAAGARNLVQVRQVGTAPGDDPSAASARISVALDRGDIADALGEWAKLPETSRTASQGWADAARSRLEADASVRALMVRAIAALAPPKN